MQSTSAQTQETQTVKPLRVLVVEDDAMIGSLIREVLAGLGHNVCSLEQTEAGAVAAAARYRPDLMIVDVKLAAGNGVAAVAAVLRTERVAHVFMSGENVPEASGAVILQKPFRVVDLVTAMQRALDWPAAAPCVGFPPATQAESLPTPPKPEPLG